MSISSLDEVEWEEQRAASMRTFAVTLHDGTKVRVFAHYWNNENPAGHLNFFSVEPSGRQLIRDAFSVGTWSRLMEVTPFETARRIDQIAARANRRAKGETGLERQRQKTSSRSIH